MAYNAQNEKIYIPPASWVSFEIHAPLLSNQLDSWIKYPAIGKALQYNQDIL